ncbi:thioredoxin family protein [Gracilimonas mengyeensis]|uniref:Thioredoxin n=1 Tax=Gracilimonas mengyeensis TaxID=1302730 RepID=A0A521E979_9BACT|nr:thioredoxin family protein [Gracilimonas mengyeensis]SMO80515.1 thioredoxin [Gracilimonas mengyeensis]
MFDTNNLIINLNKLEVWIQSASGKYHLYPIRFLGYLVLFLVLMISNSIAMIRWPFAALKRALFDGKEEEAEESFAKNMIHEVDEIQLEQLLRSRERVLIDFWAEWCGPCIMMNEPLKQLAASGEVDCLIVKVDTVRHPEIAKKFQVKGLPNLILVENRKEVKRNAGALSKGELREFIGSS